MRDKYLIRAASILLLAALLAGLIVTPAGATSRSVTDSAASRAAKATALNANIYLPTTMLSAMFEQRIGQQVPASFNSAINNIIGKLPPADRAWAYQTVTTLIQPSATLTGLTPQAGGLATSLRLSLYPGDPHPVNAGMLIQFSVINPSMVQVSARPLPGSPALITGPLTTFQIPIGQLNSIRTTPACGSAALALNLQFPVALGQAQAASQTQATTGMEMIAQPVMLPAPGQAPASTSAYVEIPASSLASLGSGFGPISLGNILGTPLSAQNIQIAVRGSQLAISSTIMLGSLKLGTATTYVRPLAQGGNLAAHVVQTTVTLLQVITFPYNSYNQQIQQMLNSKLNGALAGKFTVSSAAIGANGNIPCAASNSLILTGTASLM
jgi:hypothetical protein